MSCDVIMDYRAEDPCGRCRGCRRDAEDAEAHSLRDHLEQLTAERDALRAKVDNVRREVCRLYCASGCSCCRDCDTWDAAAEAMAELLDIPPYDDGSGFDFYAVRDEYKPKP